MTSKRCSVVHPINVFSVPLAGPGFQVVMQQPRSGVKFTNNEYDDMVFQKVNTTGATAPPKYEARSTEKEVRYPVPVPADCPKGLESLVNLEHLFVRQSYLVTEFFFDVSNKFEILTSSGEFVYLAADTTPPLTRIFCFGGHPFEIAINSLPGPHTYSWNAKGKEVLKLSGAQGSCGCGSEVTVTVGRNSLGTIEQEGDCTNPVYSIRNSSEKEVARIHAPSKAHCFACGFNSVGNSIKETLQFDVLEPDGGTNKIGRIARQFETRIDPSSRRRMSRVVRNYGGKIPEKDRINLDGPQESELWGIKFPRDMDVEIKGLLLSAVFLFEFQYYSS